jgi:ATP-dependent Clp protease ATP-binding subunit ClpA
MIIPHNTKLVALDAGSRSPLVEEFEARLRACIVGQNRAVRALALLYQVFQAGLTCPNRPMGTMLFLGPIGSGKTRVVEAAAEILNPFRLAQGEARGCAASRGAFSVV